MMDARSSGLDESQGFCSSFGHDEVPATHEIKGIPSNQTIWVPYCARCVKAIQINGYDIQVRELESA